MLREILVIRERDILYRRQFGDSLPWDTLNPILLSLSSYLSSGIEGNVQNTEILDFKLSYLYNKPHGIFFAFLSNITDDEKLIDTQLHRAEQEFVDLFPTSLIKSELDPTIFDPFNVTADLIHKELRPKIALVGFSGVGKTTITRLIRADEIPMEHLPTMTGDVATIKIGKLHFFLWDFAGQEQFSFLWPKFIKNSDAVFIITDSTLRNIDKSRFFIDLAEKHVPTARVMGIANKQDIPNSLTPEEVSEMLNIQVKGMIAIDPDNREKMINTISETLGITSQISPLLKPLFDRDKVMNEAEEALIQGDLGTAEEKFQSIASHSTDLGDDKIADEFLQKAKLIREAIQKASSARPIPEQVASSFEVIPSPEQSASSTQGVPSEDPEVTPDTKQDLTKKIGELRSELETSRPDESILIEEAKIGQKVVTEALESEKKIEGSIAEIKGERPSPVPVPLTETPEEAAVSKDKKQVTIPPVKEAIVEEVKTKPDFGRPTKEELKAKKQAIELEILDLEEDFKSGAISENSYNEQVEKYKKLRDKVSEEILNMRIRMVKTD